MAQLVLKNLNSPVKLLIALGNPDKKYRRTRHNAGYMFADYLVSNLNEPAEISHKKEYELAEFRNLGLTILKPTLYMNNSGLSVAEYLKYKPIETEHMLIVHDDLDLTLGKYKLQQSKSPRSHNGLNSFRGHVAIDDSFRLRIGIENREHEIPGLDYVLMKFSSDEQQLLGKVFSEIIDQEFSV